jgi:hypothetical protein
MNELIIIHFIGLALFSTAVPNDPGVRVLLPRVVHQHTATGTTQTGTGGGIIIESTATGGVEPHATFIVYDADDLYRDEGLWPSLELPAHMIRTGTANPERYRYVSLGDGDRVAFHTNVRENTKPTIPSLPKPSCGTAIDPTNAAAIVHIPQGVLSTCGAAVSGSTGSRRRFDTTLKLKRNAQYGLVILAKSRDGYTSKALSLSGTKPVYIVNIPKSMLTTPTYTTSGAEHFLAYYDLLRQNTATCGEQAFKSPSTATSTRCPVTDLALTGEAGALQIAGMIVDSNCSNSTWP